MKCLWGGPDRLKHEFWGMVLDTFWSTWVTFVVGEPLCDVGITFWALIPFLGSLIENRVVHCQRNIYRGHWQSGTWCFCGYFGRFFAISGHFCGRGGTLWCRNPLLSPNNFTLRSFIEIRVVGCRCNSCRVPWQSRPWHMFFWFFCPT